MAEPSAAVLLIGGSDGVARQVVETALGFEAESPDMRAQFLQRLIHAACGGIGDEGCVQRTNKAIIEIMQRTHSRIVPIGELIKRRCGVCRVSWPYNYILRWDASVQSSGRCNAPSVPSGGQRGS